MELKKSESSLRNTLFLFQKHQKFKILSYRTRSTNEKICSERIYLLEKEKETK